MMRLSRLSLASLVISLLALILTGCIPVDDVREAWSKAKVDEALVGQWIQQEAPDITQRRLITFEPDPDRHALRVTVQMQTKELGDLPKPDSDSPTWVRTLIVDKHRLLVGLNPIINVSKKHPFSNHWEGSVQRYAWADKRLVFYNLKPEVLKQAITADKVEGTVGDSAGKTTHLAKLDAKTVQWLSDTADDAEAWKVAGRFDHVVGDDVPDLPKP